MGDLVDVGFIQLFSHLHPPRPRGYKSFFVLNSVEHETINAYKYMYKNIRNSAFLRLS